jgi:uncharacterized membrane protein YdbT with pleckstrin-like domain
MPRYPERLLTDDETVIDELRPHWRVLLAPAFWTILCVGAIIAAFQVRTPPAWLIPTSVLLSLLFFLGLAVPPIVRRWFTMYVLTTERIVVRSGVISRAGSEIPLESISNVLFSQSIVERLLGYGDVLLESAGESGQSRLRNVPDPEAFQSKVYGARERRSLHFTRGTDAPRDRAAQLEALSDLHDRGKLSDDEYAAQKTRLLAED